MFSGITQNRRILGWLLAPCVLKTAMFLVAGGFCISYLTKVKAEQVARHNLAPVTFEWLHGTSDVRLQRAIDRDDGNAVAALLPQVSRSRIRDNIVERLSYNKTTRSLEAFLSKGWNVNGPGNAGRPVLAAVRASQDKALAILLKHGAKANVYDEAGRSAALWASASFSAGPQLLNMLAEHHGKMDSLDSTIDRSRPRLGFWGRVKVRPLSIAVAQVNKAAVETLLKLGANPRAFPGEELPPIIACGVGNHSDRMLDVLLKAGASPAEEGWSFARNPSDEWERLRATALYFNAAADRPHAVRVLLDHGADPLRKGSTGHTCLEVARGESLKVLQEAKFAVR